MLFRARRIFVSHSSNDDALASKLVDGLAARGLKPFVDHDTKTGIVPGSDWLQALRRDLKGAQVVLILVSDAWRDSEWCQAEYRTAKLLGKTIIPVVIGPDRHEDIEPSRQHVSLDAGTTDIPPAVVDAIARALPSRWLASASALTVLLAVGLAGAMGIDTAPFGRWEAAPLKGGAFVDLQRDPEKNDAIFALATDALGERGLYATSDCGATWSQIPVPDKLATPNRLDVTPGEILIAADNGVWSFDRGKEEWRHLKLKGLSDAVLVAKVVPGNPDRIVYGSQRPGGTSAGATVSATGGDPNVLQKQEGPGGMTIFDRRAQKISSFPFQMNDVAFHPQDPNKVAIAAAEDGVFISLDGLETVVKVTHYDGRDPLTVRFNSDGDTVYVGGKSGLSSFKFPSSSSEQTDVRPEYSLAKGEAHDLMIEPEGGLVLATTVGLFKAHSSGAAFSPYAPAPPASHINKLLRCGNQIVAATGGGGVFSQPLDTQSWQKSLTVARNLEAYSGLVTDSFQLVSAGPYVFRSNDRGRHFELFELGSNALAFSYWQPPMEEDSSSSVSARERSDEARGSYLYRESSILAALGNGRLARKPSGAASWSKVSLNPVHDEPRLNSITRSVTNPKIVLATLRGEVPVFSLDDGENWQAIAGVENDEAIVAFALPDGRFLLTGPKGELAAFDPLSKTVSKGASASRKPITGFANVGKQNHLVAVDIGGNVYALDPSTLVLSELATLPIGSETEWLNLFCCDDSDRLYLGGRQTGLYLSNDLGKTWQRVATRSLTTETSIYEIGAGPQGLPVLYTKVGMLRESDAAKLCLSDELCLTWSSARILTRARSAVAYLQRK